MRWRLCFSQFNCTRALWLTLGMDVGAREFPEPLTPAYPYNEPGAPVLLHDGEVSVHHEGFSERVRGGVELRCEAGLEVRWHVDGLPEPLGFRHFDTIELLLITGHGERRIAGHHAGAGRGWINEARWDMGVPIERAVLHWMNLPGIRDTYGLEVVREVGGMQWHGRWEADAAGWHLTLDCRPDHREVWNELKERPGVAMTHVMEVTRCDGAAFSSTEFDKLCTALHFGLSFALGRWVAPALPIGFSETGERVCERWAAWHCDPKVSSDAAWWHQGDDDDLIQLLERLLKLLGDPVTDRAASILLGIAIQGAHAGFVEQRLMTLFAGLEHLAWIRLRQSQRLSRGDYKAKGAGGRLALLLVDAGVSDDLATYQLPSLDAFAAREGLSSVAHLVTRVRNRVVHPKDNSVYDLPDLLTDTWLMSRYLFVMLLLHWMDYRGSVEPIWQRDRWAGDVDRVPWT